MNDALSNLIEALAIFNKYMDKNSVSPTHCVHDILLVMVENDTFIEEDDRLRLDKLGFFPSTEYGVWGSYRYGSA